MFFAGSAASWLAVMKATEFLKQDHVAIRRLIDEAIASPGARRREELIGSLATVLEIHGQIEEELFYPALAALSGLIPEARREHAQMRALAAPIDRRQPTSPDFMLKVGELRDAVQRHVAEEESGIFAEAEQFGSNELETIGQNLEHRKHALMMSLTAPGGRGEERIA
jgi:hemerythrin superfamily protein